MEYYPDQASNTVEGRLDVGIRMRDGCAMLSTAARHSILTPNTHGYDKGRKYARVWSQGWHMPDMCDSCNHQMHENIRNGVEAGGFVTCDHPKEKVPTQRMVCFFVDLTTGDVWKADGWKKPALNFVRGTVMTREGRYALTGGKVSDSGYFYGAF